MTLVLLCLGCPGADKVEPGDTSDTAADTAGDTGSDTAEDTAAADCLLFDVCDNGLDDDCDGEVDGAGCAIDWIEGSTQSGAIGRTFSYDREAPESWLHVANYSDLVAGQLGHLRLAQSGLTPAWRETEAWGDCRAQSGAAAGIVATEGVDLVAYGGRSESDVTVALVQLDPITQAVLADTRFERFLPTTEALAIGTVGGTPHLLAGAGAGIGLYPMGFTDLESDQASLYIPSDDDYFGTSVAIIGDINGDGSEFAVVSYDDEDVYGEMFLYDAGRTGVVAPESADIHVSLDIDSTGGFVRQAGDLDGDGYEELTVSYGRFHSVLFGPLVGEVAGRELLGIRGDGLTALGSLDGDEHPDLLVAYEGLYFLPGPIDRSVSEFSAEDAIPLYQGEEEPSASFVADLDGSGDPVLLMGAENHVVVGADGVKLTEAGLIVAFPAPDWMTLPASAME